MKTTDVLLAAVSGLLLALVFPRLNLWPLAWVSLVPLLAAADGKSAAAGFKLGWVAGAVFHLGLVYWVTVSMTTYGKLPLAASLPILLAFAAFLGLFTGLPLWAACFAQQRSAWSFSLTLPFIWVAVEHLKSWFLTGFPWDLLGYSQYRMLPVVQIADITGVYGVSFLIVSVNCGLCALVRRLAAGGRLPRADMAVPCLLVAACLVYGNIRLREVRATPPGAELRVALVQPNISQEVKWDPAFLEQTLRTLERLTLQAVSAGPGLVIWPESATPFFFQSEEAYRSRVVALAKKLGGAYLLFGSPSWHESAAGLRFHNSAFLIGPDGSVAGRYDKQHLVPYGEYVPFARFFPFIQKLVEGIGDFSPGGPAVLLELPRCSLGTAICYEIIFPDLVRRFAKAGARVMINITNDAWFGRTSAPYQHLAIACLRAVETRRYVARCANTGVSAIIGPTGAIEGRTGIFTEAVLAAAVHCRGDSTFYARSGNVFAWCCWAFSLLALLVAGRRNISLSKETVTCSISGKKQ